MIMDKDNSYEIPFGAFDSELKGWEYTIPEGMQAVIKDGKIIVREKESEDERIRKEILESIKGNMCVIHKDKCLAWLEKQGSQNLANSEKTCKDEQNPASKIKIFLDDKVVTDTEIEKVCNLPQGTIASLFASSQKQDCLKWSEGDEDVINHLLAICAGAKRYRQFAGCLQEDITKYQTWLKSLKERYTWKPSDEQIADLEYIMTYYPNIRGMVNSIYTDLKKLK